MSSISMMDTPVNRPDGLRKNTIEVVIAQVSGEIAESVAPTTALLDGTARQRRDLRILARRLNGIAAKYGVTLEEAISQADQADRPVVVVLSLDDVVVPVAADTTPAPITQDEALAADPAIRIANTADVQAATATRTVAAPSGLVPARRISRKARRAAARLANLVRVA